MRVFATCSFCHRAAPVMSGGPTWCVCGHRLDVSRLDCTCDRCRNPEDAVGGAAPASPDGSGVDIEDLLREAGLGRLSE